MASFGVVVLVLAIVLLLAGGSWLYIKSRKAHVSINQKTLCRNDLPPTEINAIVLDVSDEFTEAQRLQLTNEFIRFQQTVPRFGRIDVYSVAEGGQHVVRPMVEMCNPGDGRDMSELYENPALARKRWAGFDSELKEQLSSLMSLKSARRSPIMETLQAVALRTFGSPSYEKIPKRLVIASDLIQNVPGSLSQYDSNQDFAAFERTRYFSQVRADLTNVTVTVLYLVRPRSPQKWPEHPLFWEQYFKAEGATMDRIQPIYGG